MISIIVPVYRAAETLPDCLNGLLAQTNPNLEFILVDDGSPDRSGDIADEFAAKDPRIRVIHKPNGGVSSARNAGLDAAKGEYIGFTDCDDRVEPTMFEDLLRRAEETGADIVECGFWKEYPRHAEKWYCGEAREARGTDILNLFIEDEIDAVLWNKLYKASVFRGIRFPEGRVHEDNAMMCPILANAETYALLPVPEYHWLQREFSLSNGEDMKKLVDFWLAMKDQYDFCQGRVDDVHQHLLLRHCALAIGRAWGWYALCPKEEREAYREATREMTAFAREHFPVLGSSEWDRYIRIGAFFARFNHPVSFATASLLNRLKRRAHSRRLYEEVR